MPLVIPKGLGRSTNELQPRRLQPDFLVQYASRGWETVFHLRSSKQGNEVLEKFKGNLESSDIPETRKHFALKFQVTKRD